MDSISNTDISSPGLPTVNQTQQDAATSVSRGKTVARSNVNKPTLCDLPNDILNPRKTWTDKNAYDSKANELAEAFVNNFEKYAAGANDEILAAAPKTSVNVN